MCRIQTQEEESESEESLWGQGAKEGVIDQAMNQGVDMKLNQKT